MDNRGLNRDDAIFLLVSFGVVVVLLVVNIVVTLRVFNLLSRGGR